MKIVLITNMFPTSISPLGGVFISHRIVALVALGIEVDAFAITKRESRLVTLLRHLLKKPDSTNIADGEDLRAPDMDVVYRTISVPKGVFVHIIDYITNDSLSAYIAYRKLKRVVRGSSYDLIHAHWLYPTGRTALLYSRSQRIPCIVTCHGSDVHAEMKDSRKRESRLKILNAVDKVEFVSHALYKQARDYGYNTRNYVIIPNGIAAVRKFRPGKDRHKLIVGYVGNFIEVKRVMSFPSIFRNIMDEIPNVEFRLIGDGDQLSALKEDLRDTPTVFYGRVPHVEVIDHMSEFDVMILPSRNEGWPCVVLEAHSCGVPVVGSDKGGIPEAIGDDRLVVPEQYDFEGAFASRVVKVLKGEISIDGRSLIHRAKGFTWSALQEKEVQLYRGVESEWQSKVV